ncbi:unnamed protein product [Phytophthora lilii]|uniref:Unnamed protein product n=1 Tax=Phytophthora lilii TaxID=2077276 RepID=A0A9W6TT94_9STRA|nr:unnamed protein product [Phytophthora lilii]
MALKRNCLSARSICKSIDTRHMGHLSHIFSLPAFSMATVAQEHDELSAAQQQLEELECMFSMFPDEEEVKVDEEAKAALENYVAGGSARPNGRLQYTLYYKVASAQNTMCLTAAACEAQEVVALQLYQQMHEFLSQVQDNAEVNHQEDTSATEIVPAKVVLGRRAIYFHHIIASNKRRVVKEWALELKLRGFSKIGWPGVVIVEGLEANVQEYVRRLQHLRWKQITVRGEQTEEVSFGSLESLRRLPHGFHEFPENGMSELAAACRAAGLEDLFLTTMKIYGRSQDKVVK